MLRPELAWFAELMEQKLKVCDGKPHWRNEPITRLEEKLIDEVYELTEAVDPKNKAAEAIDVANMAMMIADKAHEAAKFSDRITKRGDAEKRRMLALWLRKRISDCIMRYSPGVTYEEAVTAAERIIHLLKEPYHTSWILFALGLSDSDGKDSACANRTG